MTKSSRFKCLFTLILFCLSTFAHTRAEEKSALNIAVAANFSPALQLLIQGFEKQTGIRCQLISAATGTLYQQAKYGAPFDVFMAADNVRPQQLEKDRLIISGSRHTYAYGQLALWSAQFPIKSLVQLQPLPERFAIANPATAPYGKAAKQVLEYLDLWSPMQFQLVKGINVNQTFQQVRSGAVTIGIVAHSQLVMNDLKGALIPATHYQPIEQQLVILKRTKQRENALEFSRYIRSKATQQQLSSLGYLSIYKKS
jgi:molybdate transport system substrate-binding protein